MTSLSLSSFASNLRRICLWIHRYTGLVMAGFLIMAGITGSLLAFHEELDDMFNYKLAEIAHEIDKVNLNELTPIDALNTLVRIKEKMK